MNQGDIVEKITGDYTFSGVIVSRFKKVDGAVRYVVENPDGILHIFSEKNLKLQNYAKEENKSAS